MKFLTGLFLIISNLLFAQQFNVNVSEKLELEGKPPLKMGDAYFAAETDAKTQLGYTFKLSKMKYSVKLVKYDKNLKINKEVKLADGEKVYGPFEPMLKTIDDKLYFLYYQFVGEDDDIKMMCSELDPSTLALAAPQELISIEQKNIALQQVMDLMSLKKFVFTASPDFSKILALWSSGINNQVYFSVLGRDIKKIRGVKEVVKNETKVLVTNACIDNAGNVFVGFSDSKKKASHILVNTQDGKSLNLDVKIANGSPHEAFVLPSINNNDIKIIGTYKENTDNLAGVFFQTIAAPNFQVASSTKTAFPTRLVEQFDNDGWATTKSKNYGIFENLNLVPILLGDGSVNLVGEFRRVQQGTKTSFMIAGGILDIHFKNETAVFSRIPKARVSAGSDIGDSFFPIAYKNQVIIFYNDHESNIKQDITKSPSRSDNYKNSVLVAATVSETGEVKRNILIDLSSEDYLPIAETLQRLSHSSVLIPVRKIKGFGKVTDDFKWGVVEIK